MNVKEQKELDLLEQRARERLEEDIRLRALRALREAEEEKQRAAVAAEKREEIMRPRPETGGLLAICKAWNAASEAERQDFLNRKLGLIMISDGVLAAVRGGVPEINDPSAPLPLRGTSASIAAILEKNAQR